MFGTHKSGRGHWVHHSRWRSPIDGSQEESGLWVIVVPQKMVKTLRFSTVNPKIEVFNTASEPCLSVNPSGEKDFFWPNHVGLFLAKSTQAIWFPTSQSLSHSHGVRQSFPTFGLGRTWFFLLDKLDLAIFEVPCQWVWHLGWFITMVKIRFSMVSSKNGDPSTPADVCQSYGPMWTPGARSRRNEKWKLGMDQIGSTTLKLIMSMGNVNPGLIKNGLLIRRVLLQ